MPGTVAILTERALPARSGWRVPERARFRRATLAEAGEAQVVVYIGVVRRPANDLRQRDPRNTRLYL